MIDVLSMVKREMKRKHFNNTDLSHKLNLHHSSIFGMLNRKTFQVERLLELSEAFQYNFFREIAEELPYQEPKYDKVSKDREAELLGQIKQLEEENKTLKTKVEVFEDVISRLK